MNPDPAQISVAVAAAVPATPGQPGSIRVDLTDHGGRGARVLVQVLGLDPAWLPDPAVTVDVPPGGRAVAEIPLTVPRATLGGTWAAAVAVQPVDVRTGRAAGPPVHTDVGIVVGDAARLALALDPAEPEGRRGRRVAVVVTNRGPAALPVTLSAEHARDLRVRLSRRSLVVPPGASVRVGGRVRAVGSPAGGARRLPFLVTATSGSAPVQADGAFVQQPVLARGLTTALALVLVIAVWATGSLFALDRFGELVNGRGGNTTGAAPAPDSGPGTTDGEAVTGEQASEEAAAAADARAAEAAQLLGGVPGRVAGRVTGRSPGGVSVALRKTELVDEAAQGARVVGRRPSGDAGKLAPSGGPGASQGPAVTRATTTAADGTWVFAGVDDPGYYLVSFAKPGFQTKRLVVDTTLGTDPLDLTVGLAAGKGQLDGTVTGPDGAVGGADITVSDGTITLTTTTSTARGTVGRWSADGLSTPGTYLVTASRRGLGSQATLLTLGAGDSRSGVELRLRTGLAAITGTVRGRTGGRDDVTSPLPGATVTVTDGADITRTATSVSRRRGDDQPGVPPGVGTYALPQLPVGRPYVVSVSAPGFATQTQEVVLAEATVADADLLPTTGSVGGTVRASGGSTGSSSTDPATGAPAPDGPGLADAGLVLTGEKGTFKTTTLSEPAGEFTFTNVPPGSYVLRGEAFGRVPTTTALEVRAAVLREVDLGLIAAPGGGVVATAQVRGQAVDLRTGRPVTCTASTDSREAPPPCRVTVVDRESGKSVTVAPDQDYLLPPTVEGPTDGLEPGLHHLVVSAPNYESVVVRVRVRQGAVSAAPVAVLPPSPGLIGTVTAAVGTVPQGTCVVVQVDTGGPRPTTPPPCREEGETRVGAVDVTNGKYAVSGLTRGSKYIWVVPGSPAGGGESEYQPVGPVPITLEAGKTGTYDSTLNRFGRVQVTVQEPSGEEGGLQPSEGASVASMRGPTRRTGTTDQEGRSLLVGLRPGRYSIEAMKGTLRSETQLFDVGLNQTVQAGLVLATQRTTGVSGTLSYQFEAELRRVGAGVLVEVRGIVGYDSSGSDVRPRRSSASTTTDELGRWSISQAQLPLVSDQVEVRIDGDPRNFLDFRQLDAQASNAMDYTLTPRGRAVEGRVEFDPDVESGSGTTVTVERTAVGSGTVTVSVAADRSVLWNDSAQPAGRARPGDYRLRFSRQGYDPVSVDFTVQYTPEQPLPPASIEDLDGDGVPRETASTGPPEQKTDFVVLRQFGEVRIGADTDDAHVASDGTEDGVRGATYTLLPDVTSGLSPVTITARPDESAVLFRDVSRAGSPYRVRVRAPGYDEAERDVPDVNITPPGQATRASTVWVTLGDLGSIFGRITGSAGSRRTSLSGAVVTATDGDRTYTAVSDGAGRYLLEGSADNPGLRDGTYTVTVEIDGYTDANGNATSTTQVTIPQDPPPAGSQSPRDVRHDVQMVARDVRLTVNVRTDDPPGPVPGATVRVTDTNNRTFGPATPTDAGGRYVVPALPPQTYSISISAPNYAPLTLTVDLAVDDPEQSVTAVLAARLNALRGIVKGKRGQQAATPLAGASVTLSPAAGTATTNPTGADGAYRYDRLPDGDYSVTFSADGFVAQTLSATVEGGEIENLNVTLDGESRQVVVEVVSATGTDMVGATVELVDTGGGGNSQGQQSTSGSGPGGSAQTIFNQVPLGDYVARTTGPGGHLAGSEPVSVRSGTGDLTATVTVQEGLLRVQVLSSPSTTTTVTITPDSGAARTFNVDAAPLEVFLTAGRYTTTATAPGYSTDSSVRDLAVGETEEVSLSIAAEGTVLVRVTVDTPTGPAAPLESVELGALQAGEGDLGAYDVVIGPQTTDAGGETTFDRVPARVAPRTRYVAVVRRNGSEVGRSAAFSLSGGDDRTATVTVPPRLGGG